MKNMVKVRRWSGVGISVGGLLAGCVSGAPPQEEQVYQSAQQLSAPFSTPLLSKLASFKDGNWVLDVNGNGKIDGCNIDRCLSFGQAGDIPVAGRWGKPGGITSIGVYRPSSHGWYLDYNNNGWWDGCAIDRCFENFIAPNAADKPIVGRWSGGDHQIGIYRNGSWFLDANGDGIYQASRDKTALFGTSSDRPVAGQWSGSSFAYDAPGIFGPSGWQLDTNGDFKKGTCATDHCGSFGFASDVPIAGKWHESSPRAGFTPTSIGTYRDGAWFLDANQSEAWDGCTSDDCVSSFGDSGSTPVVGQWAPVQYSTGTDSQLTLNSSFLWENTAAVVAPGGKPSCPKGRAFISVGQTGGGNTPALEMVGLDQLTGTATPTDIYSTRLKPKVAANDTPGTDNQLLRLSNNDLVQVRVGTTGTSPMHGAVFVWRSQDCGDTWTLQSTVRAQDSGILGGRCGLRQGTVEAAVYNPTTHIFKADTNGDFLDNDPTFDLSATFGVRPGDVVVAGDWDGNLSTKIGRYRNGQWLLDMNGNFTDDGCAVDKCFTFGAAGEIPVVGRWSATADGDMKNQVGTFKDGVWHLDSNGDHAWNAAQDTTVFFGQAGDQPIVGSWDTTGLVGGATRAGVFRPSTGEWFLDKGANGWDGCGIDRCIAPGFGDSTQVPIAGVWSSMPDYNDRIGTFAGGAWNRDMNNDGSWAGCDGVEGCKNYGGAGDVPLPGMWSGFFGGFDRAEAYADPSNGMLYVSVGCDYRTTAEEVLLSSNNVGTSWTAQTIPTASPTFMTSTPNGKLYLFSAYGNGTMLAPATVTPASNTVTVHPFYVAYQQSGAFLGPNLPAGSDTFPDQIGIAPQVSQGRFDDGSISISRLGRTGNVDSLLAVYPSLVSNAGVSTQVARVMRLDVTTTSTGVSGVVSTQVSTESSTFAGGSVMQATAIEDDAASGQVALYWKDISATSTSNVSSATTKVQAETFSLTGSNQVQKSGYITVSQNANGSARSSTGASITGDYQKGAVFTSGGLVNFFTQWVETPITGNNMHTQILSVHP